MNIVCCFIGHRKINVTEKFLDDLKILIEDLIIKEQADTFLFGSKSQFDEICLQIITEYKKIYPDLIRIYVRAGFEYIDKAYETYLLEKYDKTYFPDSVKNSGKLSYILRNRELVSKSDICVFCYDENYQPPVKRKNSLPVPSRKSGTKIAYEYAAKHNKRLIVFKDF